MRNFKRFLAMTLTMLMIVSSFSLLTSAKFSDVTDFQNEITILTNLGIVAGKEDGTFGFDENVTRRQTALLFARATSGKVTDFNWKSTVNNTPFKDLDAAGDYFGAISYCANLGIVKGKTTTEFAPNDTILFQEALTMAVRALGYGSATMDAGYPYTFYSKAISLGLDKGIEDVALTDVVTRGTMAKLIYNMLFATNSEGTTLAVKAFGTSVKNATLVLVATSSKKLVTNITLPAAADTVAFATFNNDGSLNTSPVYHFKWADFAKLAYGEGTTEKAADHVGDSFSVVTIDGFKTLASVDQNTKKTFKAADAAGNGKIDGVEYSLVQKWTSVFNLGITNTGKDELIQYNTAYVGGVFGVGTAFYGNHQYVVDAENNILAADGSILLYYKPTTTGSAVFPFAYKIGDAYYPAYLPVDGSAYKGAATVDLLNTKSSYHSNKNDSTITTNVNAYAETVAYDDNNDGAYDRAYFTAFTFGRYTKETKDGHTYHTVTVGAKGGYSTTFTDIAVNDRTGTLKSGDYVLWAHDAVNNSLTIKKVYGSDSVKTGFVTGVDVIGKTLTFSTLSTLGLGVGTSETVKYGVAKLPGATNTNISGVTTSINNDGTGAVPTETLIGISHTLLYKSISYIVDAEQDNRIVAIVDEATANTPLVVTDYDYTSMLTFGSIRMYVIDNTGASQVITVTNINGIPVNNYNYYFSGSLNGLFENGFGGLVYGAKQNDGTWLINTNTKETHTASRTTRLSFYNGIAYQNLDRVEGEDGTIEGLNFKAKDGSLVIIAYMGEDDNDRDIYAIATGIPANGSVLRIASEADIFVRDGYMYIPYEGDARFIGNGWNIKYAYDTGTVNDIIYIKNIGTFGGTGYTYLYPNSYFSLLTGKANSDIGAYITSQYLQTLTAGFYEVTKTTQNGTLILNAVKKLDLEDDFYPVYLKSFSDNHAEIVDEYGDPVRYVVGKNVVVYDWTAKDGTKAGQPAAGKLHEAIAYRGLADGNQMIILVTEKNVAKKVDVDTYTLDLSSPNFNSETRTFILGYALTKNSVAVSGDITSKTKVDVTITYIDDEVALVGAYDSMTVTGNTITLTNLHTHKQIGGSVVDVALQTGRGGFVIDIVVTYDNVVTDTYSCVATY